MDETCMMFTLNEDGVAEEYDDAYGIVIHCESKDEQERLIGILKRCREWIPVEEGLPEDDDYILLSFDNFSVPLIGRFKEDEEGGAFYIGDCDEEDTCASNDLLVNAWQPLPERYQPR